MAEGEGLLTLGECDRSRVQHVGDVDNRRRPFDRQALTETDVYAQIQTLMVMKCASHGARNGDACMGCKWRTTIANRSSDVKTCKRYGKLQHDTWPSMYATCDPLNVS